MRLRHIGPNTFVAAIGFMIGAFVSSACLAEEFRFGNSSMRGRSSFAIDGKVYFVANQSDSEDLWETDGTAEGTRRVPLFQDHVVPVFSIVGNSIYFTQRGGVAGPTNLYRTDRTFRDSQFVATLDGQPEFYASSEETSLGAAETDSLLYLELRHDATKGDVSLLRSDGTPGGITSWRNFPSGSIFSGLA